MTKRLIVAGCVAAEEEALEMLQATEGGAIPESWLRQRERGEPLAWIIGSLQFCGRTVLVDPGVYVPRLQSEELAHRAAALLAKTSGRAADLCTGAGAIAAHLMAEVPTAEVVGVDSAGAAVRCARRNGVTAVLSDLDRALATDSFDVVTAVAPYVPTTELALLPSDVLRYEPHSALDGGTDGLDLVRRIVHGAARILRRGGWLLVEIGADQDHQLAATLAAADFRPGESWFDEDGDLRGLVARAAGEGARS